MAPAADARVTTAELGRRLQRLEEDVKSGVAGLHRRLDEMVFVTPETLALQLKLDEALRTEQNRRIAHLESILEERDRVAKEERETRDAEARTNRRMVVGALVLTPLGAILAALLVAAVGLQ